MKCEEAPVEILWLVAKIKEVRWVDYGSDVLILAVHVHDCQSFASLLGPAKSCQFPKEIMSLHWINVPGQSLMVYQYCMLLLKCQ